MSGNPRQAAEGAFCFGPSHYPMSGTCLKAAPAYTGDDEAFRKAIAAWTKKFSNHTLAPTSVYGTFGLVMVQGDGFWVLYK